MNVSGELPQLSKPASTLFYPRGSSQQTSELSTQQGHVSQYSESPKPNQSIGYPESDVGQGKGPDRVDEVDEEDDGVERQVRLTTNIFKKSTEYESNLHRGSLGIGPMSMTKPMNGDAVDEIEKDNDRLVEDNVDYHLYYDLETKMYCWKKPEDAKIAVENGRLLKHEESQDSVKKRKSSSMSSSASTSTQRSRKSSGNDIKENTISEDDGDEIDGEYGDEEEDDESTATAKKNLKRSRSRGGCLTCRQRKKRCCETKPTCYECDRLNIKCRWPVPGYERKNKSKNQKGYISHDEMYHEDYGIIKILRGVVDYKTGE